MKARKKQKQMTVKFVVRVKKCKQDFGLGPGVLYTFKKVYRDRHNRGFDSMMFHMAIEEAKREAVEEVVDVQALVWRPVRKRKVKT